MKHPHKAIIDAWTADTSIEIEMIDSNGRTKKALVGDVMALEGCKFRIKPKMRSVTVDGVKYEWPEPVLVAPEYGVVVHYTHTTAVSSERWTCNDFDKSRLRLQMCHATKEGAEAHRRALVAVSGGTLE